MANKSKAAGSFLGGLTNNPGAVAIAVILGALFLFRNQITGAFGSLGESIGGGLGDINVNLPSINFPDFNFPDFNFPDFNLDFGDVFGGVQESLDTIITQFSNPDQPGREEGSTPTTESGIDTTGGLAERRTMQDFIDQQGIETIDETDLPPSTLDPDRPLSLDQVAAFFQPEIALIEPIRTILGGDDSIVVPQGDELDLGGGLSFIGGTTTFGDNIIDTFSEVLAIFPDLRASEISNLLAENIGLTGSEFRLIDPAGEINISSAGEDPDQILLNAGEFTGLTAEQISALLTGGNLSNF